MIDQSAFHMIKFEYDRGLHLPNYPIIRSFPTATQLQRHLRVPPDRLLAAGAAIAALPHRLRGTGRVGGGGT